MASLKHWHLSTSALLVAGLLSACGGGGGGGTGTVTPTVPVVISGNTATEGFNWFNFRRGQLGLSTLTRNALIDKATQNHADYMKANTANPDSSLHNETSGKPGFTGTNWVARLAAVSYDEPVLGFVGSEVIAAAGTQAGEELAEELITAIYHRFDIFEPMVKEGGSGASVTASGYTYFSTNFTARNGLGAGLQAGKIVAYPFSGQTNVLVSFLSDTESPDPVAETNEVGYPISVHANGSSTMLVATFTVRPRGGSNLVVKSILPGAAFTPTSAAAIIPMTRLSAKTTYDVAFTGTVDGAAVTQNWSFTTR